MTASEIKTSLVGQWKTWVTAVMATFAAGGMLLALADGRYDQREGLEAVREQVRGIKENVEFLTQLTLQERITRLDGRIQVIESLPDSSRDERQTLYELRLERSRLKARLDQLDGGP